MKVRPRFLLRAGLVLSAAGALGAFGACKDNTSPSVPPPPPPPPGSIPAPTGVSASAVSATKISLAWTDSGSAITGFQVDRCDGTTCAGATPTFTRVAANLAATAKTYTDSGLTASTQYYYRVRAIAGADSSAWSATVNATTLAAGSGSPGFTMVGAGEIIGNCPNSGGTMGTGRVVDSILKADTSAIAFVAGDAVADTAKGTTFDSCYGNSGWASFKARTRFAIGNGDYAGGRGSAGVYSYLGTPPGWFSFDKGNWHIVFLNSADWEGGIHDKSQMQSPSGAMNTWLASDLAAVPPSKCIAVFSWERRVYTDGSGNLSKQFNLLQAATLMYSAGVDLLVSSKDKIYARFPQTDQNGVPDTKGFRQFIVGTGGRGLDQMITPTSTNPVEKQNGGPSGSFGVLKLMFADNSYSWQFIPALAGGFTDAGGPVPCHN
ncbi:MAG TPA: fibronectin type III domain-containing protein [Gemmatimonadales bacterium]|nr:fibronectin type III domain-containing protein [Gemmatimonadales bacterium]